MSWIKDIFDPRRPRLGGVLPQPLAARQGRCAAPTGSTAPAAAPGWSSSRTASSPGRPRPWTTPPSAGPAALRAAGLPAGHLLLLVHLQPPAGEVPLRPRRAAGPVAGGQARSTPTRWRPGPPSWRTTEARASLPAGAGQGRPAAGQLGRGAGDHRRLHHLHRQAPRAGPGGRLLPHPGHVHAQLRRRHPLPRSCWGACRLSFYDWYADLPNAFPEIWGEQTDVCESADWYNSKYIVVMGANLSMTRTPDVHFVSEARHAGAKLVVLSPDFSQVSKYADWWLPVNAGQDGAFWMAVDHVILKEFYRRAAGPLLRRLPEALHRQPLPGGARAGAGRAIGRAG